MVLVKCSECDAYVLDELAAFCSRCGAPLGAPHAEATDRLDAPVEPADPPGGDTSNIPTPEGAEGAPAKGGMDVVADMMRGIRSALVAGGWNRASEAAAVGFLTLLVIGATFVLLAKLLDSSFGSGQNPLWMLTRIVLGALWSIGVTIERDGAGSAVLPLGALLVFGMLVAESTRRIEERSGAASLWGRAVDGLKVGVPFALMCFLAAVVFRIRSAGAEIGADPGAALLVPLAWGSLFGALGALRSGASFRVLVRGVGERLDRVRAGLWEGFVAAGFMLAATTILALGAVLLFLVVGLAGARSIPLSFSDAVVFVVALVAFLPNIVAGATAFALGAPIEFLARTIDGAAVERRASLIIGSEGARGYAYVLLVVPAAACLLGGYAARRRTADPAAAPVVLATAAAVYALALSVFVALSSMRVGQGFLGAGNYLVTAAHPAATLLLAAVWAGAFGYAGWRIAHQQEAR